MITARVALTLLAALLGLSSPPSDATVASRVHAAAAVADRGAVLAHRPQSKAPLDRGTPGGVAAHED